jgi:hypothetical protein
MRVAMAIRVFCFHDDPFRTSSISPAAGLPRGKKILHLVGTDSPHLSSQRRRVDDSSLRGYLMTDKQTADSIIIADIPCNPLEAWVFL